MKQLILLMLLIGIGCQVTGQPRIIFDSDMGPDYDDIGAIAALHALEAKGECVILGMIASSRHPDIAATMDVINWYFGRSDIPIGKAPLNAPNITAENNWNIKMIEKYKPEYKQKTYMDGSELYRKLLANQPNNSVTIVTVGFNSNLSKLLDSDPDQYSDLSGIDLVREKVKHLVAMAGGFPIGREFNVAKDAKSSMNVYNNWPTPILFSGFEIGSKIMTGNATSKMSGSLNSPIQWGYKYNLETYTENGEVNRASWDQTAVLVAVRDPLKYFYIEGPGTFNVDEDGSNIWDADTNSQHYFLVHKYPYKFMAKTLEKLMMYTPD